MNARLFVFAAVLAGAPVLLAVADPAPMVIPKGQSDVTLAVAGTYTLDPNHVSVEARVSHMGFSTSIFRFGKVSATLQWDPKAIEKSKLTASVETNSLITNVAGFAEELQSERFLNAAQNPQATFVSSAFHQKDGQHGTVDGTMTLMGKTFPASFDVSLVGAGPGFAGGPKMGHVIGIHAETMIDPKVIGLPPMLSAPIVIAIDTEFDNKG